MNQKTTFHHHTVPFQVLVRLKDLTNRKVATFRLRYREDLSCMRRKNGSAAKVFRVLNTVV